MKSKLTVYIGILIGTFAVFFLYPLITGNSFDWSILLGFVLGVTLFFIILTIFNKFKSSNN